MDKRTRKANKALEYAKRCIDLEYNRINNKNAPQPKSETIEIEAIAQVQTHKFDVVKIQKGLFKIEMDGQIIPKNFKSITKAKQWILKQQ